MSDQHGPRLLRQTFAGLLCTLALFLVAWNEVPDNGSLLDLLGEWIHPALAVADTRNAVRAVTGALALTGCFFCIAGMGNTLGLIPLFGGRIALSARLAGVVLGILLTVTAAVLGHISGAVASATLTVTPLAAILLLLLWLSRREPPAMVRHAAGAPPPILVDLPGGPAHAPAPRQEPTIPPPAAPPRTSQPASFTARAPRHADGLADLAPLDFVGGAGGSVGRPKAAPMSGNDLGLPPLEFTPSTPSASTAAPRIAPAPPPRSTPAAPPVAPTRAPPMRIDDGLPPLDFPMRTAPIPAAPRSPPPAPPVVTPPTLDTLDFSPQRRPPTAPLADELAQWSPRAAPVAASAPASAVPPAPVAPKPAPRPALPDIPEDLPPGAQVFTLDTVAPREQGPRRALLEDEPDLLAQLGSLAQVQTPPAAPVDLSTAPRPPGSVSPAPPARSTPPPVAEPERVKLADKGVFSIYKLVDAGQIIGYALTEHGVTVTVGSQEHVKQVLRDRWPGAR